MACPGATMYRYLSPAMHWPRLSGVCGGKPRVKRAGKQPSASLAWGIGGLVHDDGNIAGKGHQPLSIPRGLLTYIPWQLS